MIGAAALAASSSAAQIDNGTVATPQTTPPAPARTAVPIPPPPVIALPTPTPTPTRTAATPLRAQPPAPRKADATERPRPAARPSPHPTISASPIADPTPATTATPLVPPTPVPAPVLPGPLPAGADDGTGRYWLAGLAAGLIALALLAWAVLRRRGAEAIEHVRDEALIEEAPAELPPAPRARLAITFRPRRAGLNMLSATSENEIGVTNIGDAPAADIRLQLRLISAHAGQDTELASFYAEPIGRAAVPPFALAPGDTRAVDAVAALPRDAIRTLTAAGRPMFVPIVAVNLVYDSGAGKGQLAQAFAVGVERVDSAKLAPFWLDVPAKSHDQVAARPHAAALER